MTTGAPIRSMPELIQALRDRVRELQLTHETVDLISGLQSGYVGKLLAPKPIKNLGPISFESILGALGLAVVVVPDPEAIKRVESRWTPRERPLRVTVLASGLSIENEVPMCLSITPELQAQLERREYMKMIGKRGGENGGSKGGKRRLKTMSKRARQRCASHAARMRWAKQKHGAMA